MEFYRKESAPPANAIKNQDGTKSLTEPRDIELRWISSRTVKCTRGKYYE